MSFKPHNNDNLTRKGRFRANSVIVRTLAGILVVSTVCLLTYNITYAAILSKQDTEFIDVFQKGLQPKIYYTTLNTTPAQDTQMAFGTARNAANELKDMVIISAYFNLGKFQKGEGNLFFDTSLYIKWAECFAYMHNPLVFYTDSLELKNRMETLRKNLTAVTKIVFVTNRTDMWSFKMREATDKIFKQPGYPKHHPNTVIADYPCAQHAKYELLEKTIKQEDFKSDYYAWLDIGYFREMVDAKTQLPFKLTKRSDLNNTCIAYNLIENRNMNAEPSDIFRGNVYWVGGGFFFGKAATMVAFVQQYRRAAMFFLGEKLMNSDQQVLYSMYTSLGRRQIKPEVELQLYVPTGNGNVWFYLGYLCIERVLE